MAARKNPDGNSWELTPVATARRCGDGLVHFVHYSKLKGPTEPGLWLRACDGNDDDVNVKTLPLASTDVTCVACVALESRGDLRVRAD